ncbi:MULTISPECIES: ABC transporter ATP-binding protein [Aerococcus]|uniref:ABC transporter ATP-binding protein n=1 Tax=Aerococcus TaxID=1375 RepID=UPI000DCD7434|nr:MULTISPECIES: ABC transporter ATP-binding protein [Aerococcus]KAA9298788.1 ABC transporter ATP-binding protein [Aerococcus tenax]MDK6688792.1 ABC transporter ATP-binding protein [Aerococcus urinae]MDK8132931.1 ABC transporter ATP-binding protein [Aerococcus urinae]MDK8484631.1 ABC transporter ATP-binding protein [Aerococcus urinae]MDL5179478.1 ABC transporter ATP-binding protein [Aerococcus tenax]
MTNMIEVKNLKKDFNGQHSVDLDHLTVRKGEIYGFLGPNGAGKTTTMKMILSLIPPSSGQIEVGGQSILANRAYLNDIGSMIEEPSYYPNLTGYENLLVFQKMLGFDKQNILETLELVGLAEEKNQKKLAKDYSLGMKQRLALAFALVKQPQILLLDEPTNGLDPSGIHEVRELIINLAKSQGLTVLISSHILSEIEQMADRVGIINHGRLVYEGEIDQINANHWIEFRGKFESQSVERLLSQYYGPNDFEVADHILKINRTTDDQVALIAKALVEMGFPLFRIESKQESLEDIFLQLTKEV